MALEAPAAALQGAAATEDNFQRLHDVGAFNADGKPNAEQASPEVPATPPAAAAPGVEVEEGPDYSSLDDFLTKQQLEAQSFYELPVTVKVDGETKQVKLADVVKSYQLEQHVHNKSAEVSRQQQAIEAERIQARDALAQQLNQAQTLGQLARQQLLGQYQSIDWNKLRMEDPSQWAVLNTEFNQRAAQIDQHLAAVQQEQQRQLMAQQQELMSRMPKEREKMLDAIPEWRDDSKFQADRAAMTEYGRKVGLNEAELGAIYDHRYMKILHDAARYNALQANSAQAVKRVRTAPVAAQPGARTQRDPNQVARAQAKEAFKKNSRDVDAQARYFSTLT